MYRVGMHIYSTNCLTTKGGKILARGRRRGNILEREGNILEREGNILARGGNILEREGNILARGGATFWQMGANALPAPQMKPRTRVMYLHIEFTTVCIP